MPTVGLFFLPWTLDTLGLQSGGCVWQRKEMAEVEVPLDPKVPGWL